MAWDEAQGSSKGQAMLDGPDSFCPFLVSAGTLTAQLVSSVSMMLRLSDLDMNYAHAHAQIRMLPCLYPSPAAEEIATQTRSQDEADAQTTIV